MTFHSGESGGLARRRLRYAIVTSLLLHLLIIWPGTTLIRTKDTPSPLQATLRPPPVEHTPPNLPPRAVARPRSGFPGTPSKPAPAPAPSMAKPESPLLEPPGPLSVPQAKVVSLQPASKPLPGPVPGAATPAPSTNGPLTTEASGSGEAVDGLRGYRLAVASQARRFKRYPSQALASGWVGSADIRLEVGRDGRPSAATIVRSSGHELLDQAALAMIDAGALRAGLPESLRGKAFAVVLPVVFNLDDE